jgi:ribosome-binding protein aMBF1 (putative translation factor)
LTIDTSYHQRRLERRLAEDPEFRDEYERATRAIAQVDDLIRTIDELRQDRHMTKAALARAIGREPAVVRRMFTGEANPTVTTVITMLDALGADLSVRTSRRQRAAAASRRAPAQRRRSAASA